MKLFAHFERFQAGRYQFAEAASPYDITAKIRAGKIYEPILVKYTIPEGFTVKKFMARLVANGVGTAEEVEEALADDELLNELKIPAKSFEGFLYPATYAFRKQVVPPMRFARPWVCFGGSYRHRTRKIAKRRG